MFSCWCRCIVLHSRVCTDITCWKQTFGGAVLIWMPKNGSAAPCGKCVSLRVANTCRYAATPKNVKNIRNAFPRWYLEPIFPIRIHIFISFHTYVYIHIYIHIYTYICICSTFPSFHPLDFWFPKKNHVALKSMVPRRRWGLETGCVQPVATTTLQSLGVRGVMMVEAGSELYYTESIWTYPPVNMAMENWQFISDFPLKSSIDRWFPIAMFDYQRVFFIF